MKRILFSLILAFMLQGVLYAQSSCTTSFGEFYDSLKTSKNKSVAVSRYQKYRSFDFKSFVPVEGVIKTENYFSIGFDAQNQVREIIHYDTGWFATKLVVYDFKNFKIMLMMIDMTGEFQKTPVAFLLAGKQKFMFTLVPLTLKFQYQFGMFFTEFPIGNPEATSCIMTLDDNLYPHYCFLAHKGEIYISSEINYQGTTYSIKEEKVQVFFTPADRKKRMLTSDFCLDNLTYLFGAEDASFTVQPLFYKDGYPLWIYCGASWYK